MSGAVAVLQAMAVFRTFSRQPVALAAVAAAVMASGARAGAKTAGSITQLFSTVVVRLIRPPHLLAAQVSAGCAFSTSVRLCLDFLVMFACVVFIALDCCGRTV